MKILIISESNPFIKSTATNNRFLTLAEGLSQKGCEIEILFLKGIFTKEEKAKSDLKGKSGNIRYKYLLPVYCPNIFLRQFFIRFLSIKYYYKKIKKVLKNSEYDYVWLHFGPNVVRIGLLLFRDNIQVKYFHERTEYSWITLSQKSLHEQYLLKFLPQIDIMSVITRTLKTYYKQFVGEKTIMIHLPMTVDFSRFIDYENASPYIKNPYIAYCGTLSNAKDGVHILIQSFIKLLNEFPEYHLYIAGPLEPHEDYISQKKLVSEAKADGRITFLGVMDRNEIPSFLFHASTLALARPESKQAEGGFPTKLGEYLATGRPVCVTEVGEIGYYLKNGESAFIAEPGSVDSFAGALRSALSSKDSLKIGAVGKQIAKQKFNKDIQSNLLFNCLQTNKINRN